MIKLQLLPPKAIAILTARMADEQAAFYFYVSASAWCRLNGYENASKYFLVESHGEESQFKRIVKFLSDWNSEIHFPAIQKPVQTFANLQEILEMAYELEYKMLRNYETNAIDVFPYCQNTYRLMSDFVGTRNETVISAGGYLKKLAACIETDPGLMGFDKEVFEQFSFVYY